MLAAAKGSLPALEKIQARGPELNLQDDLGRTALMHSICKSQVMLFLLEAGADPSLKDKQGNLFTHHSGRECAIRRAMYLRSIGKEERTPFMPLRDDPLLFPIPPELQDLQ